MLPLERQGESIAYTSDGKALVTTSEQIPAPLWRLRRGSRTAAVDSAARVSAVRQIVLLGFAVLLLAFPAVASAKEPPNQNDPCSSGGRNTCGTLGTGFYDTYKYGLRWFGDYRGAIPDIAHTFCIDLQYWYPSPQYHFKESTADTLREPRRRRPSRSRTAAGWRTRSGRGAQRQGEPAGRGDALRPRPDGRRARRARSTRTA